jgi:Tfp pilus assembly protein PilE
MMARQARLGFHLSELSVVFVIVGMCFAIGLSAFQKYREHVARAQALN